VADIRIVRAHGLGLDKARELALRWAEVAETKLEMHCIYEKRAGHDVVRFRRAGAHGSLHVAPDGFALEARLGLLLGMFRQRIEDEIVGNLDALLAHPEPLRAFEEGLARHAARRAK